MPLLEKWTPFRELDLMDRRMRRFFEELGVAPALAPAADFYETEGEVVVELEVPGFEEKELSLELSDHRLTITGVREEVKQETVKAYRLHERLERSFERTFTLPPEVDSEKVKAEFEKGVLRVHAPKLAAAQPRTIAISK